MLRPLFDICGGDIKGYKGLFSRKKRDLEAMKRLAAIKMAN